MGGGVKLNGEKVATLEELSFQKTALVKAGAITGIKVANWVLINFSDVEFDTTASYVDNNTVVLTGLPPCVDAASKCLLRSISSDAVMRIGVRGNGNLNAWWSKPKDEVYYGSLIYKTIEE